MTEGKSGRLAISVNELEPGEYHYVLLEAATAPGELLCFHPKEIGEVGHATSLEAWFSGVGAVRRAQGI
jgi:hypothetical protein